VHFHNENIKKENDMRQTMKRVTTVLLIFAMCFSVVTPVSAATKKMTAAEAKKYSNILWNKLYMNTAMDSANYFVLYDVNGDGRNELLFSGPAGAHGNLRTIVYGYDGKSFHKTDMLDGKVVGVSSKGIATKVSDTNSAYSSVKGTCVYSFDKKFKATLKLSYSAERDYMARPNGSYVYSYTGSSNKKITKSSYNSQYKKYNFKKVGESVTKYSGTNKKTILDQFGVTASPELSDGTYTSTHSGKEFYDPNTYENPQNLPQCYKARVKDNKLIIFGSYGKDNSNKVSALGTYTFELSSCKYYIFEEVDYVSSTKSVFNSAFNTTNNSSGFDFVIENGKVTKIMMWS
jgi:hypothetical protein